MFSMNLVIACFNHPNSYWFKSFSAYDCCLGNQRHVQLPIFLDLFKFTVTFTFSVVTRAEWGTAKSIVLHAIQSYQIIIFINTITWNSSTIGRANGKIQSAGYSSQHCSAAVPQTKSNIRNVNRTVPWLVERPFRSLIIEGKKLFLREAVPERWI